MPNALQIRPFCNLPAVVLTASRYNRADSPTVTWSSLQHLLENAVPHVLLILDCCYAANAARDTAVGTTKELLAACGRENPTTGVGYRSFTSALIEELQAFGAAPFTTAMLHGRLVTMRWRLAFTPIYALLSEHGGDSIQLCPLPLPLPLPTQAVQLQNVPGSFDGSSTSTNLPSEVDGPLSTSRRQSASGTAADTRVLLAVSIAGDATLDVSQWKQWLVSQAPFDVTSVEVKVEAVFQSHSTMLVTSVPIPAWDELPDRAAYRFVGFVKGENGVWSGAPKVPQKRSIYDANLSVAEERPLSRTRLPVFGSLKPSLFPTGPALPRPSGPPEIFSSTFDPFNASSVRDFELEDSKHVPGVLSFEGRPMSPGSSAAGSAQNPPANFLQEPSTHSVSPVPSMTSGWSFATGSAQNSTRNSAENSAQDSAQDSEVSQHPTVRILGQNSDQNPAQNSDQDPARNSDQNPAFK